MFFKFNRIPLCQSNQNLLNIQLNNHFYCWPHYIFFLSFQLINRIQVKNLFYPQNFIIIFLHFSLICEPIDLLHPHPSYLLLLCFLMIKPFFFNFSLFQKHLPELISFLMRLNVKIINHLKFVKLFMLMELKKMIQLYEVLLFHF